MGLGIILGALSGAGQGVASAAKDYQDFSNKESLLQEQAALEEQKAKNVAQFTNDLAVNSAETVRQGKAAAISKLVTQAGDQAASQANATAANDLANTQAQTDATTQRLDLSKLPPEVRAAMVDELQGNVDYTKQKGLIAGQLAQQKAASDPDTLAQALDAYGDHEGAYKIRAGVAAGDKVGAMMAKIESMKEYLNDKNTNQADKNRMEGELLQARIALLGAKMEGGAKAPPEVALADAIKAHKDDPDWLNALDKAHTAKDKTGLTVVPNITGDGAVVTDNATGSVTSYKTEKRVPVVTVLKPPTSAAKVPAVGNPLNLPGLPGYDPKGK